MHAGHGRHTRPIVQHGLRDRPPIDREIEAVAGDPRIPCHHPMETGGGQACLCWELFTTTVKCEQPESLLPWVLVPCPIPSQRTSLRETL